MDYAHDQLWQLLPSGPVPLNFDILLPGETRTPLLQPPGDESVACHLERDLAAIEANDQHRSIIEALRAAAPEWTFERINFEAGRRSAVVEDVYNKLEKLNVQGGKRDKILLAHVQRICEAHGSSHPTGTPSPSTGGRNSHTTRWFGEYCVLDKSNATDATTTSIGHGYHSDARR